MIILKAKLYVIMRERSRHLTKTMMRDYQAVSSRMANMVKHPMLCSSLKICREGEMICLINVKMQMEKKD